MNTFRMSRQLWAPSAYLICTSANSYICQMRTHALLDSAKCMSRICERGDGTCSIHNVHIYAKSYAHTSGGSAGVDKHLLARRPAHKHRFMCKLLAVFCGAQLVVDNLHPTFAFSSAPHQYHNATVRYVCAYVTECF